jgi:hypothetical protein
MQSQCLDVVLHSDDNFVSVFLERDVFKTKLAQVVSGL